MKTTLALITCQDWRTLESSSNCQAQLLVQSVIIFGIFGIEVAKIQILPNFFKKWHLQIPNIKNFTEELVMQILTSPNTLQRPQITPNTNFLWLFGAPNVKAWLWWYWLLWLPQADTSLCATGRDTAGQYGAAGREWNCKKAVNTWHGYTGTDTPWWCRFQ